MFKNVLKERKYFFLNNCFIFYIKISNKIYIEYNILNQYLYEIM